MRSAARYAALWLLLGAVAYFAFDAFLSPKVARPAVIGGNGTVIIERSRDQHFYVAGAINGHTITFMVDTGATVVTVSDEQARQIGLGTGVPAAFDTAAGRVAARIVPSATVQVGGIRVEGLRVGISGGGPALLGQNFLNKVELRQDGQRMTLRVPSGH